MIINFLLLWLDKTNGERIKNTCKYEREGCLKTISIYLENGEDLHPKIAVQISVIIF